MPDKKVSRLHWKLYFPLVGLLWLIIGITICYFVQHESHRQKFNLENRLMNVNNTVIDAYNRGLDLQETVNFIQLFTDNTTLTPLRITVYDRNGRMVADNPEATILLIGPDGKPNQSLLKIMEDNDNTAVRDILYEDRMSMISSKMSDDGEIYSLAALPYEDEVADFLRVDPMIWFVVIALGLFASLMAYVGVRAVCQNVYALRDFADAISHDILPQNVESIRFSHDELGDVSKKLLMLYRDKINAENARLNHERQISMNISHELKTPVGIIKGYVDTILTDPDMPEAVKKNFLVRIQQNTDRLTNLITDVSAVMNLDYSGAKLQLSAIDFGQLTERVAQDIRQGHVADGMDFTTDVPASCRVMAHESLLTNVLLNLIYNAVKYSGGTEISLRYLGERDGMRFFVFADNGRGVSEEHLARLFDMFYRVDSGRAQKNGGTGLGLPLVRRIITAMGGKIRVENVENGGLKFTFTLRAA